MKAVHQTICEKERSEFLTAMFYSDKIIKVYLYSFRFELYANCITSHN